MPRRLLLLFALGGCDLAFGLSRNPDPPVCGPYARPTMVPIDPGLVAAGAHDFSIDATGTVGTVTATLAAPPLRPWNGPHAIKLSGGMWVQDVARDKIVLDSLDGGHMLFDGKIAGWDDVNHIGGPTLREYKFSGVAWQQDNHVIESDQTTSSHVGNVISDPPGNLRTLVELRIAETAPFVNQVLIRQRTPVSEWMLTGQADPLRTARPQVNPSGAALTMDHERLVYTANVAKEMDSGALLYRMFASQRVNDSFEPGVELIIDGMAQDAGYAEPWINADCTELYFRQGDTTWMTVAK